MKRSLPLLAAVAVIILAPAPAQAAAPTGRFVALGDSYTSGPLIPSQVDLNCGSVRCGAVGQELPLPFSVL